MSEAVLTRRPPAPAPTVTPPFATWPVLSIALAVAVAHIVTGFFGDYWLDESYMLAAGKYHPDWGYADQPPLVPLLAAAMDWIAPGSLPMLRVPAALATAGTVVVTALTARELGGDRRAQVLASLAVGTGFWLTLGGHWLTPYAVEPLLWGLISWLLCRWIRLRDDRLLLALGLVIGINAQTKFQVVILCVMLLVTVLIFGPRELLRRPMFWGGIGISALVALPTLIWQATHEWPQLQMAEVVVGDSPMLSGGRVGTAITLVAFAGLMGTVLFVYGTAHLLFSARLRPYRFLGLTIVGLYALFVATAGRPYYLVGVYAIAVAAGAVALQRRREAGATRGRWVAWPAGVLSIALAGMTLSFSVFGSLAAAPGFEPREVAQRTAEAYGSLPEGERERTAIAGEGYIVTAFIDAHGGDLGLPPAHSWHRGYGYFGPPDERHDSVLYVGRKPEELRPYFAEMRQIRPGHVPIWLYEGRTQPWEQIWPRITRMA